MTVEQYLEQTIKHELKWMYHYDVDHDSFGIATDKYHWCKMVLEGKKSIEQLLEYFTTYYPNDEQYFINKIGELL